MNADARALLRVLADESRLRVHAAVLLGAQSTADVVQTTGLSVRAALQALTRLESVRLVTRDRDGWVAHPEVLRAAAKERRRPPSPLTTTSPTQKKPPCCTLPPRGVLVQIPAAQGKRRVVLDHVARVFEVGVRYPEREVNAMLRAFHPDYAALRRISSMRVPRTRRRQLLADRRSRCCIGTYPPRPIDVRLPYVFDTIFGLPVHALVIHAVVVLLLLAALGVVLMAAMPRWRPALRWPTGFRGHLDREHPGSDAQRSCGRRIGSSELIETHAELGDTMIWFGLAMLVLTAAFVFADRARQSGAVVTSLAVLAVLASGAATVQVMRTGHAGTTAVWQPIVDATEGN